MKDFKIVRISRDNEFKKVEKYIQDMSENGWKLISVSTDVRYPLDVIVTLQKDN